MPDMPFEEGLFRFQYKQALDSGYVEGIYNCNECEGRGTFLLMKEALRELACSQCGSTDVARTVVQINL